MKTEYLAQVAYLMSRGFTQGEAGGLVGLKSSETSRLVAHAYALGLLKRPVFSEEVFLRLWPNPKQRINLEQLRLGLKLKDGLIRKGAKTLMQVRVFSSVSYGTTPEMWNVRLCDFGCQVLPHFHELLASAKVCGMGWGSTVGAIISAAEREGSTPKHLRPTLAATCGELFVPFKDSSSSLVERLHSLVDGEGPSTHTLRGLPALLPPPLREFYYQEHPGYRAIFDPDNGLAKQFDAIITSVGAAGQEGGTAFKQALVAKWGITPSRLKDIAWGDIGGVLVPRIPLSSEPSDEERNSKSKRQQEEERRKKASDAKQDFERITSLWTGISFEQYRQTAERAAGLAAKKPKAKPRETPGVIVYAIGANKAEIVHEVVKAGLVNRIVIDLDLAKSLAVLANIDLLQDVRRSNRPETLASIMTAFDHLSDSDKASVRVRLEKNQ